MGILRRLLPQVMLWDVSRLVLLVIRSPAHLVANLELEKLKTVAIASVAVALTHKFGFK